MIPEGVTRIGAGAFWGTGLTSIEIPNGVTSIGDNAFYCSSLTSVVISEGVRTIGETAFRGCSSLTSITIPSSVISIRSGAFQECDNLTSVTVMNPLPVSISRYTFENRANATLYVPKGSKEAYETADYWKEFKEIIEMEVDEIEDVREKEPGMAEAATVYDLNGRRLTQKQQGVNIIRTKDGKSRKVLVK